MECNVDHNDIKETIEFRISKLWTPRNQTYKIFISEEYKETMVL